MSSRSVLAVLFLALLSSVAAFDCYDTLCSNGTTAVPCDQSKGKCVIEGGAPKCVPDPVGGVGVNCSSSPNFYCSANSTGSAVCVYETSSCYNSMCQGTGDKNTTYIACDQSNSTCGALADGTPTCVPGNPGMGVNCTVDATHDEYYCQNNLTTGAALCVYPPKHDCYDTTCTGKEAFNTTVIPCDQSKARCGFNVTGGPICINTTRGEGVDCPKDDQFYCSVDAKGAGLCVVPANHTCYDTKCVGKTKTIDCDQKDHRCVLDKDGEATCVNTTRGGGVDCSGVEHQDFYCGNNEDTGAAICKITPPSTCYNLKCAGTGAKNTTYIDCDQSKNLCQVNETGDPACVPLSRGSGVNCTKDATHDEYYCQNDLQTGTALCVYPPKHDCYDTTCTGKDAFNTTTIPCDQSENRCGFTVTGRPMCINTTRGAGVDCKHTSPLDFYCSNSAVGAAQCTFTPPKSCYNQFCQGTGSKNTSWVSCDGSKNRCGVAEDGSPKCVPGSRGAGVDCNETTSYYCSHAAGDPFTASCHVSQNFSCYNSKCQGVFNYTDTYIGCSQDKSYCGVSDEGFPLCLNDTANTGDGVTCTGHFSCKEDKTSGVAACQKKSGLLPVWIVLGVVIAIVIVIVIIWVIKRRSSRADDRDSLITAAY